MTGGQKDSWHWIGNYLSLPLIPDAHTQLLNFSAFDWTEKVSKAGTSDYIPQYLRGVITCPSPWYLILAHTHLQFFHPQLPQRESQLKYAFWCSYHISMYTTRLVLIEVYFWDVPHNKHRHLRVFCTISTGICGLHYTPHVPFNKTLKRHSTQPQIRQVLLNTQDIFISCYLQMVKMYVRKKTVTLNVNFDYPYTSSVAMFFSLHTCTYKSSNAIQCIYFMISVGCWVTQ